MGSALKQLIGKSEDKKTTPKPKSTKNSALKSLATQVKPRGEPAVRKVEPQVPVETSVKKNFLSTLKDYGKIALELPKGLVQGFTKPSETTQQLEKNLFPTPKNPVTRAYTAPVRTLAKGFTRLVAPGVEGLGRNIGDLLATKEINKKVVKGELPSNAAFESIPSLSQNPVDTVLGVANAVLSVYSPKFIKDSAKIPKTKPTTVFRGFNAADSTNAPTKFYSTKPEVASQYAKINSGVKGSPKVESRTVEGLKLKTVTKAQLQTAVADPKVRKAFDGVKFEDNGSQSFAIFNKETKAPEIKTSKLAQGVEAKAIESKLTSGFKDLPEYTKVNVKEQATAATKLLTTERDRAVKIAMGQELPPDGVLPESVFVAVEDYAIKTKDVALLKELATASTLSTEATGMGQRIRMLAERNPNSAVATIQKVSRIREEVATRRYGDITKAKAKVKNEITSEIQKAAPKAKDWAGFLDELKCR